MTENNCIGLGNLFPTYSDLLKHLAEFGTLTDEQIQERTSTSGTINVEACLTMMLERDFCKEANNNIIKELYKSSGLNYDEQ